MIFFIVFSVLFLTSCAHIVIEERLYPFLEETEKDEVTYHPKEWSDILEFNSIDLQVKTNHYQTSYRGLKVVGAEISRYPDYETTMKEFVLILGVKTKSELGQIQFNPYEIKLNKNIARNNRLYQPVSVFKTKSNVTCTSDFDGANWGGRSVAVESDDPLLLENRGDGKNFNCFNIVFNTDMSNLSKPSFLFNDAFNSIELPEIFLSKKKIRWMRGN